MKFPTIRGPYVTQTSKAPITRTHPKKWTPNLYRNSHVQISCISASIKKPPSAVTLGGLWTKGCVALGPTFEILEIAVGNPGTLAKT